MLEVVDSEVRRCLVPLLTNSWLRKRHDMSTFHQAVKRFGHSAPPAASFDVLQELFEPHSVSLANDIDEEFSEEDDDLIGEAKTIDVHRIEVLASSAQGIEDGSVHLVCCLFDSVVGENLPRPRRHQSGVVLHVEVLGVGVSRSVGLFGAHLSISTRDESWTPNQVSRSVSLSSPRRGSSD